LRIGFPESEILAELKEIEKVAELKTAGIRDLVRDARPGLIAAAGLAILQQFVGINSVLYYGPTVIRDMFRGGWTGDTNRDALIIQMILGTINFLGVILAVFIINKKGNKYWLILGALGMGVCLGFLAALETHLIADPTGGYIAILLIALYLVFFEISWGPIVWNTIGEIFPLSVRGVGASIATSINWFSNFGVMFLFPTLIGKQANGSANHLSWGLLFFFVFAIASCFFVKYFVPETRGKSLEEIEEEFRHLK
jgi:MFS family permease